ncbi:MAG: transposase [Clostridia bacterium]|jgi:putative transposase
MEKTITKTYNFFIQDKNLILWNLAKETASIYNDAKNLSIQVYEKEQKTLSAFDIQKQIYHKYEKYNLHSDSKIASIQQYTKARKTYFEMLKEYEKNPKKFDFNIPLPPTEDKEICAIFFKKSAIRYKKGHLLLSLKKQTEPLKFKWNKDLPIPHFCIISYKPSYGWKLSCVFNTIHEIYPCDKNKELGIDLGIKRIATIFDGKNTLTFNGKIIQSNIRLKNKLQVKTQSKLSKLTKHSRKYKKIKRSQRKINRRIKNKNTDILKKYSRYIVNYCVKNKISKITIGKCDGIHKLINKDKKTTQMRNQFPEQILKNYIIDMFDNAGGTTEVVPEPYTSKTCPKCNSLNVAKNRSYICSNCNFKFDRDGVGSINIWNLSKNVSLEKMSSNVVGGLTPPRGIKFFPRLSNYLFN